VQQNLALAALYLGQAGVQHRLEMRA
jgi:hypothetical protein